MDSPIRDFMARHGARLVDNGYPVIPIRPGTKKPGRLRRGEWREYPGWSRHCDRPTTLQEIEVWATWPEAGIGFAGGAVVGVDIDVDDPEVALAVDRLARERLGDTPLLRIGRPPKRLLLYRAETPFKGIRASPIEVLCRGQQFLAFAIHPDTGRPYEWPEESPLDVPLASLPAITEEQARAFAEEAWNLIPERLRPARLTSSSRKRAASLPSPGDFRGTRDAVAAALAHIPNADLPYDEWVRIGMALKGALGEDGADLFATWSAQSAKDVPETTAKAWASFRPTSIGAGTIYHHAIERGWRPDPALVLNGAAAKGPEHPAAGIIAKAEAAAAAEPPIKRPPPEALRIDGALGLMVDYIVGSAIRPQPLLAIGASLAALGTLMGRRYRTGLNLRSNVYVVCMAASGGGKDHARNCIREAFLAAGLSRHLGGNRLASGAGLLSALYRQPASLFQIDEFGQVLSQIVDKRRAPKHLAEIWDLLTQLYSAAGGTFLGDEYADQKERPRRDIIQPCCCIHATTVPEPMWSALRHASLHDGSLARFLVFRAPEDIPDRNRSPRPVSDVPAGLIAALQAIAAGVPGHGAGDLAGIAAPTVRPVPFPVPMAREAAKLLDTLEAETTERQRQAVGTGPDAVFARICENTEKLAMIRAVSADPASPLIRLEDMEWARAVVGHCAETLLAEAERHLADNETERNHKRVLEIVRQGGAAGIARNDLTRRTQFLDLRQRTDIIEALKESGQIVAATRVTGKRLAIIYRIGGASP